MFIPFSFLVFPTYAFDFLDLDFSIAWQPFTFFYKINEEGATDLHDYFERGQYTTYRASLKFRKGLNLGFGIRYDSEYNKNNNIVGKFSDIMANIGYNRFDIRVGHGNSNSIEKTTVDLLMDTYGLDSFTPAPWYMFFGFNYTYLSSPLPLSPLGGYYYSIDAETQLYGIVSGSDLFNYFINAPKSNDVEFYPWWDGYITLGLGTTKYLGRSEFVYDFRVTYTGGLLIGGEANLFNWCLGLGYNVDGGLKFMHHGLVARFGIKM